MEENEKAKEVDDILLASEFLPLLKRQAEYLKLNVYVFNKEDFKDLFEVKSERLGIALLAKDVDNARYNLKNLRRCYLIRFDDGFNEINNNGLVSL